MHALKVVGQKTAAVNPLDQNVKYENIKILEDQIKVKENEESLQAEKVSNIIEKNIDKRCGKKEWES